MSLAGGDGIHLILIVLRRRSNVFPAAASLAESQPPVQETNTHSFARDINHIAILSNPDDVVAMVKNGVTSGCILEDHLGSESFC
jgi:hypothetical protein